MVADPSLVSRLRIVIARSWDQRPAQPGSSSAAHTLNLDIEGRARLGELGIHVGERQAFLHSVTACTGRCHAYDLLIAVYRLSTIDVGLAGIHLNVYQFGSDSLPKGIW